MEIDKNDQEYDAHLIVEVQVIMNYLSTHRWESMVESCSMCIWFGTSFGRRSFWAMHSTDLNDGKDGGLVDLGGRSSSVSQ